MFSSADPRKTFPTEIFLKRKEGGERQVGTSLTYLLVAVKVVLVIGGHAGVGVVPTGGGGLAGVEASHHPGVEI